MYQYILFDLDGTLSNSAEGITKCIQYALEYYGITVEDRKELERFIGPPLEECFIQWYDFSEAKAAEAKIKTREYFSTKGIWENKLYQGVQDLLQVLKQQGKTILLATSKPQVYAEQILDQHHIKEYFDFVGGSMLDGTRSKKADVIAYILEQMKLSNNQECIMVGDTKHDILGAKENNMDSIGVLYGFGSKEEVEKAEPTYIVTEVKDILEIIQKN